MATIDRTAPLQFLHTAYLADDWLAIFLKNYQTGETTQRVVPVSVAASARFQAWLRHRNARGFNVYVSVNAIVAGRSRTKGAVATVRHVFLEEDRDGARLLSTLASRPDLPPVSYVLHSSRGRIHVFWRVHAFEPQGVEALQRHLAREMGTDRAATSCSQTTRLPGFMNHKYESPSLVCVEYRRADSMYVPADFPAVSVTPSLTAPSQWAVVPALTRFARLDRARRFVSCVPPAIAGQHGDARTFRLCCRLVRGFALTDDEALAVLTAWNRECQPPWSERELLKKVQNARRYGREPLGGLVDSMHALV